MRPGGADLRSPRLEVTPGCEAIGFHSRHRERSVAIQRPPRRCFRTFGGGNPPAGRRGVSGSPRRFTPREDGAPPRQRQGCGWRRKALKRLEIGVAKWRGRIDASRRLIPPSLPRGACEAGVSKDLRPRKASFETPRLRPRSSRHEVVGRMLGSNAGLRLAPQSIEKAEIGFANGAGGSTDGDDGGRGRWPRRRA